MISRKPVRPEGDPHFAAVGAQVDSWLSGAGYHLRAREGSMSWSGTDAPGGPAQVLFKLIFLGAGDVLFGVRKEFAACQEKLRDMPWPLEFVVPPHKAVVFVGLRVANDEGSLARVERLLRGLTMQQGRGMSDPNYEQKQAQFDQALDELGL